MCEESVIELVRQAPFSFVGTVEHLGAAMMSDIRIDDRTAVVHVDYVLHAPDTFAGLEGQHITLQLAADRDPPVVGDAVGLRSSYSRRSSSRSVRVRGNPAGASGRTPRIGGVFHG